MQVCHKRQNPLNPFHKPLNLHNKPLIIQPQIYKARFQLKGNQKPLCKIHHNCSKNIVYIQNLCINIWK